MCRTASQEATRIKLFLLISIVLLLLFPYMIAYASTPTLTPSPVVSPTPNSRSIMESFDVQIFNDGACSLLEKEMISAHEYYRYADGILMFMPLSEFVANRQIPCLKLGKDFNYCVNALDPGVSVRYSHTIYNQEWKIVLYGETSTFDWSKLDSGKYLMSINVFATDGNRYANTASLCWLIVGDYEGGEEPVSISTPSALSAPTPT